jgi:hypothetical protein
LWLTVLSAAGAAAWFAAAWLRRSKVRSV